MKKSILLSILSAILLILIFPKFNLSFLVWVALVPLFFAIEGRSLKESFGLGFLTGFIRYWGTAWWLKIILDKYTTFSVLGVYIALAIIGAYFSLYPAFFCLTLNFIRERVRLSPIIIAPVLWTTSELIRSLGVYGLPWALLGYSQWQHPPLIQIASFTGVYGVTFLIVMINATLKEVAGRKFKQNFISISIAIALLVISLGYGFVVLRGSRIQDPGSGIRISVIQPNIDQYKKWEPQYKEHIIDTLTRLSREANFDKPQLIVWPETCVPSDFRWEDSLYDRIKGLVQESNCYFIIGTFNRKGGRRYNSAFLFSPKGEILGQYNKVHLVPFAEQFPFQRYFALSKDEEIIEALKRLPVSGREYSVLISPCDRFGVPICFETIFPNLVRRFVKSGANIIVNITDDAWFERISSAYEQSFAANIFRAVENRISIVRAANTGISGFIDPYGRIRKRTQICATTLLTDEVVLRRTRTPYTKYGNLFAYLCFFLSFSFLAFGWWRKKVAAAKKEKRILER